MTLPGDVTRFVEGYLDPFIARATTAPLPLDKGVCRLSFSERLKDLFSKNTSWEVSLPLAREHYVTYTIETMHRRYAFMPSGRGISLEKQEEHCSALAESIKRAADRDFPGLPPLKDLEEQVKRALEHLYEERIKDICYRLFEEMRLCFADTGYLPSASLIQEEVVSQFPCKDTQLIQDLVKKGLFSLTPPPKDDN